MPFHPFDTAYSPFTIPAIQGELNPYKHFASHQSTSVNSQMYNPLPSVGLRDQVVPRAIQPDPTWESLLMATQNERTDQLIPEESAFPAPEELIGATKLNVEQLDAIPLAKEEDFRLLMPQARSLPFQNSANRRVDRVNAESKLNTMKRKNLTDSTSETQPAKRKSANEGKTLVRKTPPKKKRCTRKPDSMPAHENVALPEHVERPTTKAASKTKTAKEIVAPKKPATKRPLKKDLRNAALPKTSVRKASPKNSLTQKPSTEVRLQKKHKKEKPPRRKKVEKLSSVSPSSEPSNKPASLDAKSSKGRTTRNSRAKVTPTGNFNSLQEYSEHQASPPAEIIEDRHLPKEITKSHFSEKEFNSTLVVAEPKMLDALNKMTWNIMNQYEADLDGGRNRFEVAQFYVDSIYDTRFAFWYAKLKKLGGLDARHVRGQVF